MRIRPSKVAKQLLGSPLQEGYSDLLDDLVAQFQEAVSRMPGSSGDPKNVWLDLGVRLNFIDDTQAEEILDAPDPSEDPYQGERFKKDVADYSKHKIPVWNADDSESRRRDTGGTHEYKGENR